MNLQSCIRVSMFWAGIPRRWNQLQACGFPIFMCLFERKERKTTGPAAQDSEGMGQTPVATGQEGPHSPTNPSFSAHPHEQG